MPDCMLRPACRPVALPARIDSLRIMGVELLFVRHATPKRHEPDEGVADPGLSPTGSWQADRLASWLVREGVDAVYVSPSRRAVETAAPLAQRLGIPPIVVAELAEFDHGSRSYIPVEELRAINDERWRAMARGELFGGVDPAVFRGRVVEAMENIVTSHPGQKVVAVTHAGVINAYLGHVLGVVTPLWFAPRYVSISRVAAARTGERSVVTLNEACHVQPNLEDLSQQTRSTRARA